jgi:hypothetical protein
MVVPAANAAAAPVRPATDPGVRIAAVGDIACKNPPGNNPHVCRYDSVSDLPGNHEYGTADAAGYFGYFGYFGNIAHGPGGWYSYDPAAGT